MQRRAAAVSVAFFLLVAAGAYAVIGLIEEPTVDVDAEHSLSAGQSLTLDGTEYTVSSIGGEDEPSATIEWTNESARFTETLEHDSTLARGDTEFRVVIPNESEPTTFALVESFDVAAILAGDDRVEDETVTRADGREYVVYQENGTTQPLDEYLPEPQREEYGVDDEIQYENETMTVAAIESESVTLERFGPEENSVTANQGGNATLGDTTFVANFPDGGTLELTTDHAGFQNELDRVDYYHERRAGLWAVVIISSLAAVLLASFAYMPSRY